MLERYLARHAMPAAASIAEGVRETFGHVLVVPAYDETPACLEGLLAHCRARDALLIVVLNAPDNAPATRVQRTLELSTYLRGRACSALLQIDHIQPPLPRRQGVGLARRLGSDVAAHLWQRGHLKDPWLYQTDADATLPDDYFQRTPPSRGAMVFDHRHVAPEPRLQRAADLYDAHMDYYVAGLASAGSDYAFPTLGSTVAVHVNDYAAVRGIPRRNAGEDFYLLNKLAKVAPVHRRPRITVTLQARLSTRVPFGTGPALTRIERALAEDATGATWTSYHPDSFRLLQTALRRLDDFAASGAWPPATSPSARAADAVLNDLGLARVQGRLASHYRDPEQRRRTVHQWFDGFRTLRFVHEARRLFPDQPLLETLRNLDVCVQKHRRFSLRL